MRWKLKAAIQRACAALPIGQEAIYYRLQRSFGTFRRPPNPLLWLEAAVEIVRDLRPLNFSIEGARVFEVGTGRRLDLPIGFYLAGAASVDTVDLHRYLRAELVEAALSRMREERRAIIALFESIAEPAAVGRRLDALLATRDLDGLLRATSIRYHAPADAAHTKFAAGSFDLHVSYTVLEHIEPQTMTAILHEAARLLAPNGLAFHAIDPSDHFSHDDSSISAINFLRFPESEWRKYGGNQFAYHNRLRASQYYPIYNAAGHEIMSWVPRLGERALRELRGGFPLDTEFAGMDVDDLATVNIRVGSRPRRTS